MLSYCGSPNVSALVEESREAREERSALARGAFLSTANVAITAATTLSTPKLNRLFSFSATLDVRWKTVTRCASLPWLMVSSRWKRGLKSSSESLRATERNEVMVASSTFETELSSSSPASEALVGGLQ